MLGHLLAFGCKADQNPLPSAPRNVSQNVRGGLEFNVQALCSPFQLASVGHDRPVIGNRGSHHNDCGALQILQNRAVHLLRRANIDALDPHRFL